MNKLLFITCLIVTLIQFQNLTAQSSALSVETWIPEEHNANFQSAGRIFLFINAGQENQPRLNTWPGRSNMIFAANIEKWKPGKVFTFDTSQNLSQSGETNLDELPAVMYCYRLKKN